eukprot:1302624-Alexandrium_andersonii.AAC.1
MIVHAHWKAGFPSLGWSPLVHDPRDVGPEHRPTNEGQRASSSRLLTSNAYSCNWCARTNSTNSL